MIGSRGPTRQRWRPLLPVWVVVAALVTMGIGVTAASWSDQEYTSASVLAGSFALKGSVTSSTSGFAQGSTSGTALAISSAVWSGLGSGSSVSTKVWLKNVGTTDAVLQTVQFTLVNVTGGLALSGSGTGITATTSGFSSGDVLSVGGVKEVTFVLTAGSSLVSRASGTFRMHLSAISADAVGQTSSASWTDDVWFEARVTTAENTGGQSVSGGLTAGSNTVFANGGPVWTANYVNGACVNISVTTDSATAINWSVALDTSAPPWNGATSGYDLSWGYAFSGALVGNRYLTMVGRSDVSPETATVVAGLSRTFQVCNWAIGAPKLGDPDWYTVSISNPVLVDSSKACRTVTVTAKGRSQFWFKWQASVTTASLFTTLGIKSSYWWEFSDWNVVRDPFALSTDQNSPSTVTLTSATNDTTSLLNNTKTFAYDLCLRGS